MDVDLEIPREHFPPLIGILLLALGLVVGVVAILIQNPYSIAVTVSLLVGAPIGLLFLRSRPPIEIALPKPSPVYIKSLIVAYFLTASALVAAFVPGQPRSLFVHGAQLVLYLICAVLIVMFAHKTVTLGLLVGAALVHRLTLYWASSVQIGLDALYHARLIEEIVAVGTLAPLLNDKYYYAPWSHLLGAISEITFGADTRIGGMTIMVATVVLVVLSTYVVIARFFTPTAGLLGGYLIGIADYVTHWAVQLTPTTLGIALFMATLVALTILVEDRRIWPMVVFLIVFGAQTLTHQISVLATTLAILAYLSGRTLYLASGPSRRQAASLASITGLVIMTSWITARRGGPAGDRATFLAEQLQNFILRTQLELGGEAILPETGVALSGSDALTLTQVCGFILLFLTAVIGSIHTLRLGNRQAAHFAGIGGIVAITGVMLFPTPAVGVSFFLPNRWHVFFYAPCAILGGVGTAYLFQLIADRIEGRPSRDQLLVAGAVILLLAAPYTTLMTLAYPGAIDGPVIDDAPGAHRITTTPKEATLYQHTVNYGDDDITAAGDQTAYQILSRYYGHNTVRYAIDDRTGEHQHDEPLLLVDRAYAETDSVSFTVNTNRRWRVYGPLPFERDSTDLIYNAGDGDELRYQNNESGGSI